MNEVFFRVKYVEPFYLDLMNLNFLQKPEIEILSLFDNLNKLAKSLDNDRIVALLNDTWRESKVGAWMICLSNKTELKSDLIKVISSEGIILYSEHILMSLLILDKQNSGTELIKFAKRQVNWHLEKGNFLHVDSLSLDWCIAILRFLDKTYDTKYLTQVIEQGWWKNFDRNIQELRFYKKLKEKFEPQYYINDSITELLKIIKKRNINK